MKITNYQITETDKELTILLPPSKEKGIFSIIIIIVTFIAGLIMEWCYFHDIISIAPITRFIFTLVLLSLAFVGFNDLFYLERGYERIVLNKKIGTLEFNFQGFYRFGKQEFRLDHITFLGTVDANNKYAFKEIGNPTGRVSNRENKATIIVSDLIPSITEDEDLGRDFYFGYGIEQQDAAVIGQRIWTFLKKK